LGTIAATGPASAAPAVLWTSSTVDATIDIGVPAPRKPRRMPLHWTASGFSRWELSEDFYSAFIRPLSQTNPL
ncbi:hypothetical protein, partial [Mycobacteroides abscessus]|uniref:hypothetical protein n=1 Tax=Mycobacteroides abscessus TaxID=36809 RepID=UPI001A9952D2